MKDDFGQYGIELVDLIINAITPPDEVQKVIDERTGMGVIGNMGQYMQYKSARAIEEAAQNQGGTAGATAGLGIGAGLVFAMPGMINQAMQQAAAQGASAAAQVGSATAQGGASAAPAAMIACPSCHAPNQPTAKFCAECGKPMTGTACPNCKAQNPPGAKFCAECGTKL